MLAVPGPGEVTLQAVGDRPLRGRRRLDGTVLEGEEPGIGLGLQARRRAALPDQMADLVEGDEVGDLASNRRDRDLEPAAAPADRPPARGGARKLDSVLAAEVLDVRLHQVDALARPRCLFLPEHGRQGSRLHGWVSSVAILGLWPKRQICAWRLPRSTRRSAISRATRAWSRSRSSVPVTPALSSSCCLSSAF